MNENRDEGKKKMKRVFVLLLLLAAAWTVHAAEFQVKDTAGKSHALADYKGKWVLVNFWATWCPPCLKEIPDFVTLYDARKTKDLMVLGIAVDYQSPKEVTDFAKKISMSYPLILGDDAVTAQFGVVVGLPVSFLYNPQGKLVLKKVGLLPKETIEKYLAGISG